MKDTNPPRIARAHLYLENPLGLDFPIPKSEPNLESATLFRIKEPSSEKCKADKHKNKQHDFTIPSDNSYTFTIA